jgi:hypothetical protein
VLEAKEAQETIQTLAIKKQNHMGTIQAMIWHHFVGFSHVGSGVMFTGMVFLSLLVAQPI